MTTRSTKTLRRLSYIIFGLLLALSVLPTAPAQAAVNVLDPRVFEWHFYLQNNPDLLLANYRNQQQAEAHWKQYGIREGRQAHPGFHTKQYLILNSDVANVYGATNYTAALEHYLTNGIKENRVGYIKTGYNDNGKARWTAQKGGIYVSASSRTAGAVDSIIWNNREFINSFDHGREAQVATQKNNLSECYNPTQAGSESDGMGFTSTSHLEAIRTNADTGTGDALFAQTLPAFWGAPNNPNCKGVRNTTTVSNYRMNTAIQVGYGGFPQAIQFKVNLYVPEQVDSLVTEVPAIYAFGDFTSFYTIDLKNAQAQPARFTPASGSEGEVADPVILATPDGKYAIACWSPELPQSTLLKPFAYAYGNFIQGNTIDATTKLRATFRANIQTNQNVKPPPVLAKTNLKYRAFIVVGTLSDVTNTLKQMYAKRTSL